MSRILLLAIIAVWLIGAEQIKQPAQPASLAIRPSLVVFLFGHVLLVAAVGACARVLSRRVYGSDRDGAMRGLDYFHWATQIARWLIPVWLAFAMFGPPGWGNLVLSVLGPVGYRFQLPAMLLGTLPAFATLMGLWMAEYPAERAVREQNYLDELMSDMPVRYVPRPWRYFILHLRQQLLPIVLPVVLITLIRDAAVLMLGRRLGPGIGDAMMIPAAALIYLAAPELFRWLFDARPLEASPLRARLEDICRRGRLRYRDILLWRTDNSVANAQVVGILPGWRYVMLSDRLLETMDDRQIEAVFAHELGHIVHRHMVWFLVFFGAVVMAMGASGEVIETWLRERFAPGTVSLNLSLAGYAFAMFGVTLVLMSRLSRRFERQADVFAARMMEGEMAAEDEGAKGGRGEGAKMREATLAWAVGPRGAQVFISALLRVAAVNNLPIDGHDPFHPSIRRRVEYLRAMREDPARTAAFDRMMRGVYLTLILALLAGGVMVGLSSIRVRDYDGRGAAVSR